jgi:tRNA(Ile2) C34 agmatinyltransferase TiaS
MTMAQFTAVTDRATIIRIMASKRRRELISTIATAVIVIPGLFYVIVMNRIGHGLPVLALVVVALMGNAYSYVNSRCPACDTPIGAAIRRARYCPGCGTQLVPDEKLIKPAAPPEVTGPTNNA